MGVRVLLPKRLVNYMTRNYGDEYQINETQAKEILTQCDNEFDGEFSEEELLNVIEDLLNNIEDGK